MTCLIQLNLRRAPRQWPQLRATFVLLSCCRSLRPAQDAASVLQHYIEANPSRRITDQDSESIRNPQHEEADETVQQQHASGV